MPAIVTPISLLIGIAIALTGNGLLFTLLGLRADAEQFSSTMVGVMMSAYFVGFVLGPWVAPALVRRVRHIRAFVLFSSGASVSVLLHGLWVNEWFWVLLRVCMGLSLFGIYMVAESWLNAAAKPASRGLLFSIYQLVNLSALALGQQLLLLGEVEDLRLFVIAGMLFSVALIPMAISRTTEPPVPTVTKPSLTALFRASPLGASGIVLCGLTTAPFWTLMAVYVDRVSDGSVGVALTMTAGIVGGALAQLPLGYISDRVDRRRVIQLAALASAVLAVALLYASVYQQSAIPWVVLGWGAASLPVYGLSVSHINDRLAPEQSVPMASSILLSYGIGAAIGPFAAGYLMGQFGSNAMPYWFAGCMLLLVVISLWRSRQRAPVPVTEQLAFVPGARAAMQSLEVQLTASHETEQRS